jgi:hypothetical protein
VALLFFILFFSWFVSAVIRGNFSYSNADYSFKEHPVQYVIVCVFLLAVSAFCMWRWLIDMEFI